MKLFHQLLVAPAALGLLAPVAANATELNINGVSDYAATGEQVTSITQFSDVYPTDWAYQALSNLIERYGCVAGYPNGTYRGNRAMTRFEAAALLNACLDRVTEVTDELKRLMKEFEKELAILKGRVDGLEARVGELEATQFSTTTKLKGVATFVIGANSYSGNGKQYGGQTTRAEGATHAAGATTFNYDFLLYLTTSFTGKDLLQTVLHANNFQKSAFSGNPYVGLDALATAFQGPPIENSIIISSLFYKFKVGEELTFAAGPLLRQDNILAVWPSTYPSDPILQVFTYAGSPATYNKSLGPGVGAYWEKNNFSISANYISTNGEKSRPGKQKNDPELDTKLPLGGSNCEHSGGIMTNCAASNSTFQIAYSPENWGVAAAYTYSSGANARGATELGAGIYQGSGTFLANVVSQSGNANSVALSAWWTPIESNWNAKH